MCSATVRAASVAVVVGVGVVAVIGVVVVVLVVGVLVVAVADEVGCGEMTSAEQLVGGRQAVGTGHYDAVERSRGLASCRIPGLFFRWLVAPIVAGKCHRTVPAISWVAVAPLAAQVQRAVGPERVVLLHRYIGNDGDYVDDVDRDTVYAEEISVGPEKGLAEMLALGVVFPRHRSHCSAAAAAEAETVTKKVSILLHHCSAGERAVLYFGAVRAVWARTLMDLLSDPPLGSCCPVHGAVDGCDDSVLAAKDIYYPPSAVAARIMLAAAVVNYPGAVLTKVLPTAEAY